MTPLECLSAIGWSKMHFAKELGRPRETVLRWLDGSARMPANVEAWLMQLAEYHRANPAPAASRAHCPADDIETTGKAKAA